jgi:hypothetical protein
MNGHIQIVGLMEKLDDLLRRLNPYIAMYKKMRHVAIEEERKSLEEGKTH